MPAANRQTGTLGWAGMFLAIALLAAIGGFAGVADVPATASWVLLVLLLCSGVFAAAFFGADRSPRR